MINLVAHNLGKLIEARVEARIELLVDEVAEIPVVFLQSDNFGFHPCCVVFQSGYALKDVEESVGWDESIGWRFRYRV